ncbi:hypothetical protein WICMUC_000836 [Wickerhamomyces mucosus]|uniref:DNA topoisomerase (ATP-hydrolyzing) n=1 Tax=Wickerhamomyces mucosus TaxID=1378264 RepID=A0A9P8PYJ4_9ASCO|nr:hypothetical protein WICMUC_000836 [Wickerhamomyces mucosus]
MVFKTILDDNIIVKSDENRDNRYFDKKIREINFYPDLGTTRRSAKDRLKSLFQLIYNGIKNKNSLKFTFNISYCNKGLKPTKKIFRFPSSNVSECHKVVSLIKIIEILISNLEKNHIATRRDIYYQDVELFGNQSIVDMLIETLCKSLGFSSHEIGAIPSQKGLFYGNIELISWDNSNSILVTKFHKIKNSPILIPRLQGINEIKIIDDINFILVVEKEAVFNSLINSKEFGQDSNSIIVTGKGYPDRLTKEFLSIISQTNPNIPIFAIVDFDPYGINIFKQYKTGGKLDIVNGNRLKTPSISLINGSIMDYLSMNIGEECLRLNLRDFTMAKYLIESFEEFGDYSNNNDLRIISECQRMMFLMQKAEIDVIKSNQPQNKKLYQELCHEQSNICKPALDIVEYIQRIISNSLRNINENLK